MENESFLKNQLITYIGNKRKLLPFIGECVEITKKTLKKEKISILDGFAGSGIVSRYFKQFSSTLYSNDLEQYSFIGLKCYLSNESDVNIKKIKEEIDYLNNNKYAKLPAGIIEELYAPKNDDNIEKNERVFYTNQNAKIIDNVRRLIDTDCDPLNKDYLLAPLLSEASIHTNTSGVFKGFYKNNKGIGQFGGNAENCLSRIKKEIVIPYPIFSKYKRKVKIFKQDINDLVMNLKKVDLAYFDPPYNQHPYGSNYFMLNVIANYVKPNTISKVSGIPDDWNKSKYNKKNTATLAFDSLISNTNAKFIAISYNDEGILSSEELLEICKKYGKTEVKEKEYNAFKGSRNLANRKKNVCEKLIIIRKG